MWEIWTNSLMPKALKIAQSPINCPKSNKLPNLVTLLNDQDPVLLIDPFAACQPKGSFTRGKKCIRFWQTVALPQKIEKVGREPWSSGYGKRLTFQRSRVRFPAPYTGWTFFTFICCKNCLKRPKINEKEAGLAHFLKKVALKSKFHFSSETDVTLACKQFIIKDEKAFTC